MATSDEMGLGSLASDADTARECAACLAELDAAMADVQQGRLVPEGSQTLQHLRTCPECADTYGDALWMSSSSQVTALQEALFGGQADFPLAGLGHLWRWHFGLRNQYGELSEVASALSVLGMICRQQGDWEQACRFHQLALENCPESPMVQVISNTDLGFLALREGRTADADRYLSKAAAGARALGDSESERRIQTLVARVAATVMKIALVTACLRQWLKPHYAAAPGGSKVFVVNTCMEVPLTIHSGPEIDREGNLRVIVMMDSNTLSGLPEEFYFDLLFLPTADILCSQPVRQSERDQLIGLRGLEIKAKVPYAESFLDHLAATMEQENLEWRKFPPTGCALRIRW